MRVRKYLLVLSLISLGLVSCDGGTPSNPEPIDPNDSNNEEPTITVTVESILTKLWETPIVFEGVYDVTGTSKETNQVVDESTTLVEGYLGSGSYFNIAINEDGDEASRYEYYANSDTGYVETRYLDPTTNTTVYETVLESYNNREPFEFSSVFYNPWFLVDASMGILNEEDNTVTFELNDTAGGYLFYMFTAYSGIYAQEATVTYNPSTGDIENVYFVEVVDAYFYTVECTYVREFTYEYVTIDEIDYYNVEPRTENEKTEELQAVFNSLQNGNYTVYVEATISGMYITTNTEYITIYSTSAMLLEETDGYISGFVDDEETGYRLVEGTTNNNELTASNYTYEGNVSDLLVPFTILGSMFDYEGDNTYVYANRGTEDFLYLTMPEHLYTGYEQYTPMVGTYRWVLNNDGTISISYDVFNDVVVSLSIKATVCNINSTDLSGYTVTIPDTGISSGSWADVDGAEDVFAKFGIPIELMPWFSVFTDDWSIYDYYDIMGSATFETTNSTNSKDDALSAIYDAMTGAGWTYIGENSYGEEGYTYEYNEQSLNISFYVTASWINMMLYTPNNSIFNV